MAPELLSADWDLISFPPPPTLGFNSNSNSNFKSGKFSMKQLCCGGRNIRMGLRPGFMMVLPLTKCLFLGTLFNFWALVSSSLKCRCGEYQPWRVAAKIGQVGRLILNSSFIIDHLRCIWNINFVQAQPRKIDSEFLGLGLRYPVCF